MVLLMGWLWGWKVLGLVCGWDARLASGVYGFWLVHVWWLVGGLMILVDLGWLGL